MREPQDCSTVRLALGADVVGGLEPDEAEAVRSHVEDCARCRGEREELAEAAALLDLARSAPPPVPSRVRDRVIAAATRRHVQRRWLAASAAAVLLGVVLGGLVGWQLGSAPTPTVAVPLQVAEPYEATGHVAFRAGDDHVVVTLDVEGLEPLDRPGVYEAWLYTVDGRIVSIGQLHDAGESVVAEFAVDGSLGDYRGFWVTAEPDGRDPAHEGPTVLRAPVPEPRW